MSLQIFVCLDYLVNNDKMDKKRAGGIIIPMCTPQMNSFEGYCNFDTRKGGGKFILFANAITQTNKKN